MDGPAGRDDAFERDLRSFRAPEHRRLIRSALITAVAVTGLATVITQQDTLESLARGEIDLLGHPVYRPPHRVDPDALRQIDFGRVHARLLPAWVVARAHIRSRTDEVRADEAYGFLRQAVAADANITDLLDELNGLLKTDPRSEARRIDYLLWAYNRYLDDNGIPWRVEATLYMGPRLERPQLHTRSYEVLADLRTRDDERLRIVRQVDLTTLVAPYLGHASHREDGALIVMDRVLHFAVRHVWPSLHPALDERLPPGERLFASHVRQEARQALGRRRFALLQETAVDQQALIEVAESIHARQVCGNRFRVWGLPYNGLSPRDRRSLRDALDRSEGSDCPEVTLEEAARMVGASERLGATEGIEEAVEALASWVARGVAVHELRHIRDGHGAPDCDGCDPRLGEEAQAELSAYVASFRTPGLGYVSLLQTCAVPVAPVGASRDAVTEVRRRLLPGGCEGGPPEGLYGRAAALERELFGSRDTLRLPRTFPRALALLPRPPTGRYVDRQ